MNLKVIFLFNMLFVGLLIFLVEFVGNDIESVLIVGIVVYLLIVFIFVGVVLWFIIYKDNIFFKDEDDGWVYVIWNGRVYVLIDNEV